jgi:hypothetical protein
MCTVNVAFSSYVRDFTIRTHFMFNNVFFRKTHAVYETLWQNMVKPVRPQTTVCCGACALHAS